MKISLYTIAHEYRAMVDALMETQDDAQAIKDTIESESWPLEVKALNVAYAIKQLEALASAIKQAEADMALRRKSAENRAESIRQYLKECMEIAGVSKIDCPQFSLSIRNNPSSVDIFEPALIPKDFMRQPEPPPPAPDKKRIAEAIKHGDEIPGARLTQGTRLEIK